MLRPTNNREWPTTTFSRAAWSRNARAYETIRTMPFNADLAAGSLSEPRFKHYDVGFRGAKQTENAQAELSANGPEADHEPNSRNDRLRGVAARPDQLDDRLQQPATRIRR
jgi:hypothetical protein